MDKYNILTYYKTKGEWIPPNIRAFLVAMRPWSFTVSLMPAIVAAALLHARGRYTQAGGFWNDLGTAQRITDNSDIPVQGIEALISPYFSLYDLGFAFLGIITAHAAGNLINTFFDYESGLDRQKNVHVDDMTLIKNLVSKDTIMNTAIGLFAIATAVCGYFTERIGWHFLYFAIAGIFLGYAYTGTPFKLKYRALGDIAVFLAFGPVLFGGCTVALSSNLAYREAAMTKGIDVLPIEFDGLAKWMSVVVGLLAVAILHTNNTRDVVVDAHGGANTFVQRLSFRQNYWIFVAVITATYIVTFITILTSVFEFSVKVPLMNLELSHTPAYFRPLYATAVIFGRYGERDMMNLLGIGRRLWVTDEYDISNLSEQSAADMLVQVADRDFPTSFLVRKKVSESRYAEDPLSGMELAFGWGFLIKSLVLICLTMPWAVRLCARFRVKSLRTMPQQTAQFMVLYCAALACCFVDFEALARIALAILYLLGGINNLLMWHHSSAIVEFKLGRLFRAILTVLFGAPTAKVPYPTIENTNQKHSKPRKSRKGKRDALSSVTQNVADLANYVHQTTNEIYLESSQRNPIQMGNYVFRKVSQICCFIATIIQILASCCFMLNLYPRTSALILLLWISGVTVIAHDFWNDDIDDGLDDSLVHSAKSRRPHEYMDVPDQSVGSIHGDLDVLSSDNTTAISHSSDDDMSDDTSKKSSRSASRSRGSVRGRTRSSKRSKSRAAQPRRNREQTNHKTTAARKDNFNDGDTKFKSIDEAPPMFCTDFDNNFVHFFKNVGMAGGLAIFLVFSSTI